MTNTNTTEKLKALFQNGILTEKGFNLYKDLNADEKYIFNAIDELLLKFNDNSRLKILRVFINKYFNKEVLTE